MKVLFANVAITSYTHPLLEKLMAFGCDLVMLIPGNNDKVVGKGVKLSDKEKHSYRIRYSRSKRMYYGKPALTDLKTIIIQENPDIVVIVWPYFLHLFFDKSILKLMQKNKIRMIINEIPFQTPPFRQLSYFKLNPVFNENMELQSNRILFKLRALFIMYIRRFLYSQADASLNYASHAFHILPSYGISPDDIIVSYNTSDTDSLLSERKRIMDLPPFLPACPRILHIGRLVKWKRVDLLIEAFCKIAGKYPSSELVIIGDGPEKDVLIHQSQKNGLTERIIFTGAIHDSHILGRYMHESSVYVLAGMGGLSINDAMCFSLPVICSVCDGTEKDLITDGVNGYFFKSDDADSLADKIDKILSNKERSKRMGAESYQVIKEKINLDTVAQRYMDAFNYVLNKKYIWEN